MSELAFTDQTGRLKRIVSNALDGAAYVSSRREEGGRNLLVEARRSDGQPVTVRFLAVKDSGADAEPAPGSRLKLNGVRAGGGGCLMALLPRFFPRIPSGSARVRIDAGDVRLDIICEDAEWWEDEAPPAGSTT